ncbi:hypothetical protein LCC45_17005, partial [Staphylococcus aureus]|nr:hypothetical protein [Staphylococcus aureus]
ALTKEQRRTFYNSMAWRDKRSEVMQRDHFECQRCKRLGKVTIDELEIKKNYHLTKCNISKGASRWSNL